METKHRGSWDSNRGSSAEATAEAKRGIGRGRGLEAGEARERLGKSRRDPAEAPRKLRGSSF